jgi:hypothetical protein
MTWSRTMPLILALAMLPGAAVGADKDSAAMLGPDRLYDSAELLQTTDQELEPSLRIETDKKNAKLAMLYSLILPGLGQQYLGHSGRAKIFYVAEGAIWTSFAVFRIQGNHREDLYKEFAAINAGPKERDDDDFYRTIGNFVSSDGPFSANEEVRRQARALFPDDRDAQDQYFEDHAYTGDDAWEWESEDAQQRFGEMRTSSLDAYHRSELAVGLLVANRLVSVLDVGLLAARRKNDHADDEARLSWNLQAVRGRPGAQVTLSRRF